ncbi:ATP-binding cassette domain-containing protein [Nakamurella antarctica]|uniref:ATP-binding cassette domain-containing protein n=1 Tax=Nakamurella antarctica TaxID=1902245 RepID=A0A3G8ZI65_9ACTN|nr:amino acid ABC transporter permease/ATP-binding protein [Nakamurella antarctica]AZI56910.1 ATP-binding cassette domain-containing protein [Nakamurella antarctica]
MTLFWHYLTSSFLWEGLLSAVQVAAIAMVLALVLGLILATMRESKHWWIRLPATIYVWIMRGTPLLLQLIYIYNVLPEFGITLNTFQAAVIGFALNEAAFSGEIIRGGIRSVARTQIVAAQSLGMSSSLTLVRVVLPQALRAIVPALSNNAISLLKSTSLAYVIALSEVMSRAVSVASQNFEYIPVLSAAGVVYLAATTILTGGQMLLERKFSLDRDTTSGPMQRMFGSGIRQIRSKMRTERAEDMATHEVKNDAGEVLSSNSEVPLTKPATGGVAEMVKTSSKPEQKTSGEVFVTCRNISKSYGPRPILRSVDLDVKAGEVVVIMGPSGSGKSTLLRLINHLEPMDGGEILVDGKHVGYRRVKGELKPVGNLAKARADARIGMVFQHFNLFDHLPVIDNVTIAPTRVYKENPADVKRRAIGLLTDVGLHRHIDHLPHRLSGGQQQRVAIARALAITPNLMLFDEPTSALDPELVGEVLSVIRKLADAGMTMIIVTHEVRFARDVADKVVFMDEGVVVEQGTPQEVLENPQNPRTRQFLNMVAREEAV